MEERSDVLWEENESSEEITEAVSESSPLEALVPFFSCPVGLSCLLRVLMSIFSALEVLDSWGLGLTTGLGLEEDLVEEGVLFSSWSLLGLDWGPDRSGVDSLEVDLGLEASPALVEDVLPFKLILSLFPPALLPPKVVFKFAALPFSDWTLVLEELESLLHCLSGVSRKGLKPSFS